MSGVHARMMAMYPPKEKKAKPKKSAFGIGAEKAFERADTAVSNISKVADMLKVAATEQMAYTKKVSKQMHSMAMDAMEYSAADREKAEQQMRSADDMYARYDNEYKTRQAEYNSLWKPVEQRTADLAMKAGKFDESVIGRAAADAAQASASSDAQIRHELAQMGISPESGKYGDWAKKRSDSNAMLEAVMKNKARAAERERMLTTGLSGAASGLTLGHNIFSGDIEANKYKLNQANTLYGLSNQSSNRAAGGQTQASNLMGKSSDVRASGMSGLTAAGALQHQAGTLASGLASIHAPLAIEKAKADAEPTIMESMQQRISAMNTIDDQLTEEGRSYPWSYVLGGSV